jgi:prepilin-type N-terminal cleavage/methylation domain-containing protein
MKTHPLQSSFDFGYTLLEIIVVVTIISLFTALSIGYYRNFDEQKKLDGDVKQFIDVLNLAANKANSGDLNPNPNCTDFQGYSVLISSTTSYSLEFNCGDVYTEVQAYNLKSNISFTGTDANILFKPLTGGTNLIRQASVTFTNNATGKCKKILINPLGGTEETTCE